MARSIRESSSRSLQRPPPSGRIDCGPVAAIVRTCCVRRGRAGVIRRHRRRRRLKIGTDRAAGQSAAGDETERGETERSNPGPQTGRFPTAATQTQEPGWRRHWTHALQLSPTEQKRAVLRHRDGADAYENPRLQMTPPPQQRMIGFRGPRNMGGRLWGFLSQRCGIKATSRANRTKLTWFVPEPTLLARSTFPQIAMKRCGARTSPGPWRRYCFARPDWA